MAVAFDAASNSGSIVFAASATWSHTTAGSNRLLFVGIAQAIFSVAPSSVTYAGTSMTFIRTDTSGTNMRTDTYYLIAPASGANNVVATMSASAYFVAHAVSLTGVHQTNALDANNGAGGTNGGSTVDVTSVADNSWAIDVLATDDSTITVGAGQTERVNIAITGGRGAGSTEGPKTPAGAITMSWDTSLGSNWVMSTATFAPASSSGVSPSSSVSASLSPSSSVSPSSSASPSLSPSSSVSPSLSPSSSVSPSSSISRSLSPSSSVSPSSSASASLSPSASVSRSLSPSASASASLSPSSSVSPSASVSQSLSPSASISQSLSPSSSASASLSPSASVSPSGSASPSLSPSASVSLSLSPSSSMSASLSPSTSVSPSLSPSSSLSASLSPSSSTSIFPSASISPSSSSSPSPSIAFDTPSSEVIAIKQYDDLRVVKALVTEIQVID